MPSLTTNNLNIEEKIATFSYCIPNQIEQDINQNKSQSVAIKNVLIDTIIVNIIAGIIGFPSMLAWYLYSSIENRYEKYHLYLISDLWYFAFGYFIIYHFIIVYLCIPQANSITNNKNNNKWCFCFYNSKSEIFHFGAPRVGNKQFIKYIMTQLDNFNYYRITHANDPVPQLPILGYQGFMHGGMEIWCYKSDDSSINSDACKICNNLHGFETENIKCSLSTLLSPNIKDHIHYAGINISNLCNNDYFDTSSINNCSSNTIESNIYHCDSFGINKSNNKCNNHCSKSISYPNGKGYWNEQCSQCCPLNCDSQGCSQSTGKCINHCKNSDIYPNGRGYWGDYCENICPLNCDGQGCSQSNGKCINHCTFSERYPNGRGYWGEYCDKICPIHCDGQGCSQSTGKCINHCANSTVYPNGRGYYGAYCNYTCPIHCDSEGCSQSNSKCINHCANSDTYPNGRGYWGAYCENMCVNHCDEQGCSQSNGKCINHCDHSIEYPNGKGYWGSYCDKICPNNCDERGCSQLTGKCYKVVTTNSNYDQLSNGNNNNNNNDNEENIRSKIVGMHGTRHVWKYKSNSGNGGNNNFKTGWGLYGIIIFVIFCIFVLIRIYYQIEWSQSRQRRIMQHDQTNRQYGTFSRR